jgi:hypothetical protein
MRLGFSRIAERTGVESVANTSKLIYASSNGDQWFLARDVESGQAFVRHVPNPASGGEPNHIEIDAFLSKDRGSPQRQELMRMIPTEPEARNGKIASSSGPVGIG